MIDELNSYLLKFQFDFYWYDKYVTYHMLTNNYFVFKWLVDFSLFVFFPFCIFIIFFSSDAWTHWLICWCLLLFTSYMLKVKRYIFNHHAMISLCRKMKLCLIFIFNIFYWITLTYYSKQYLQWNEEINFTDFVIFMKS